MRVSISGIHDIGNSGTFPHELYLAVTSQNRYHPLNFPFTFGCQNNYVRGCEMKVLKLCDVMVVNSVMHNSSSFGSVVVTFLNSIFGQVVRALFCTARKTTFVIRDLEP